MAHTVLISPSLYLQVDGSRVAHAIIKADGLILIRIGESSGSKAVEGRVMGGR